MQVVDRLLEEIRLAQIATDRLDEAFARYLGINRTDQRCLDIVERHGSVTAGKLADEAGLTTGAITTVLDRLQSAGYLQRVPDPTDRRRVLVELTPTTKQIAEEVYGPIGEACVDALTDATDDQLVAILEFHARSRRLNLQQAELLRRRTSKGTHTLRWRLEEARRLRDEAKALYKRTKSDLKFWSNQTVEEWEKQWRVDSWRPWVDKGD